jgi:hypothetical protein
MMADEQHAVAMPKGWRVGCGKSSSTRRGPADCRGGESTIGAQFDRNRLRPTKGSQKGVSHLILILLDINIK